MHGQRPAQVARLDAFRLLIKAEPEGRRVGNIAKQPGFYMPDKPDYVLTIAGTCDKALSWETAMNHEGGCLCSAIRYAVTAPPSRVTMCHCRFCQRATGGAYLVEPIFAKPDFSLTRGTTKVYQTRSEGSGKAVDIHFCDICGTKLFLDLERFPAVVGVYGGTFDNPNWFERSPANSKHIFLGVAQHGTVIPAGIDTFVEHAMTKDDAPVEPTVYATPKVIDRNV